MTAPNPTRSLPSIGVQPNGGDETCEHEMVSLKMSNDCPVRYVEQCRKCQFIDEKSLQWWVEDAIKNSLSNRAKRIAIAAESQPFQFVQQKGEDLTLEEILFQAMGAASVCWAEKDRLMAGEFDSSRAKEIGEALLREVNRALQMTAEPWANLAYEYHALACNSRSFDDAHQEAWAAAFKRLKDRFHELLPEAPSDQDRADVPQPASGVRGADLGGAEPGGGLAEHASGVVGD